jgi:hypothetical protein
MGSMITPFKRDNRIKIKPYGIKARVGQWRVTGLWVDDKHVSDPYKESRHERFNFNNSRKYPHSNVRQQVRQLRKMGRPQLIGVI